MTQQMQSTKRDDEERQLASTRRDLVQEFSGRLPADEVGARFDAIVAEFDGVPVRTFVPVLARRRVRQVLVLPD